MDIKKMMFMEGVEGDGRGMGEEWERVKRLVERDSRLNRCGIIDEGEMIRRWESYREFGLDWIGIRNMIYEGNKYYKEYSEDCFLLECIWYGEER